MSAAPNYSFKLVADMVSGNVSPGFAMVKNADGSEYVTSTTAARGSNRSSGLSLGAAPIAGFNVMQCFGDVDPVITGLTAEVSGSPVRVSATGALERCTPVEGDDVVGWADPNGTLHCAFGLLPWNYYAGGAAFGPAAPQYSAQFYAPGGAFGGAAHQFFSADGYPEFRAVGETAATEGEMRGAATLTTVTRDGSSNTGVWGASSIAGVAVAIFGGILNGSAYSYLKSKIQSYLVSREQSDVKVVKIDNHVAAVIGAFGPDGHTEYGTYATPNLALYNAGLPRPAGPFKGGVGYLARQKRLTAATGNPDAGFIWDYVDETTLHPMWRLPDGTLYDLSDGGEGTFALVSTSGDLGDLPTSGIGTYKFIPVGNASLPGLVAPTSASASKHIILIIDPPSDTTFTLLNDVGSDADENGLLLNKSGNLAGSDVVVSNPSILRVTLVYDQNAQRWLPVEVLP